MSYKRKVYLINPSFQLRFSLYVSAILIISNLAYPFVIYEYTENFIFLLSESVPNLSSSLKDERQEVTILLISLQVLYTLLVFTICIFFSHKIAGPLYKFKTFLIGIRQNTVDYKLSFRKGDYFTDLAEEFNNTWDKLEKDRQQSVNDISEIRKNIRNLGSSISGDERSALDKIAKSLGDIQERLNKKGSTSE